MPSYKLHYFNGKGRAEMLRLVFAVAGVEYEDFRIDGDWADRKKNYPFGQLPALEVDGRMFGQSMACASFLAREFDLYGSGNMDALVIEQVLQLIQDVIQLVVKFFFEKDEKVKEELMTKFKQEQCPKFFGFFEKMLADSGSGFFVGKLSLADIAVYDMYSGMMASALPPMEGCPLLKALVEKVGAMESIKAWEAKRPQTNF